METEGSADNDPVVFRWVVEGLRSEEKDKVEENEYM